MKEMLGDEYPAFLCSYEQNKSQALRLNTLKSDKEAFLRNQPFTLSPVPWTEAGYYYPEGEHPGKHPYHAAGVYYVQEASAMVPAEWLEAAPGELILDLCAAPGGKTTQIAAGMKGEGILFSNEIHSERAGILSENVERMGIRNAVVLNETPQKLSAYFPEYFHRILVDAPCSGEGMFRKNEEAVQQWSIENVNRCAVRQDEILEYAAGMLCPGGRLVYSTCTFAPAENEGTVSRFLSRHPEFYLMEGKKTEGMGDGEAKWTDKPADGIHKTIRIWPHKVKGEGHFVAVLQKSGKAEAARSLKSKNIQKEMTPKGLTKKELGDFFSFRQEFLKNLPAGKLLRFGEQLYLVPEEIPSLAGLRVLRPGLHLGTLKKNRFEPSHALALSLGPDEVSLCYDISAGDNTIREYLRGQTFPVSSEKGWYLITVDGYGIGWGKLAGGMMKNHYPKGLRCYS